MQELCVIVMVAPQNLSPNAVLPQRVLSMKNVS